MEQPGITREKRGLTPNPFHAADKECCVEGLRPQHTISHCKKTAVTVSIGRNNLEVDKFGVLFNKFALKECTLKKNPRRFRSGDIPRISKAMSGVIAG